MSRLRSVIAAALMAASVVTGGCIDKPTEHRVRANAYLRAGEAQKALDEIEIGLEADPDNVSLFVLKGKALFELTRYDESKIAFEAALSHGKDLAAASLAEAHLGLAMVAMRKEQPAEAKTHFDKLVEINAKDADAHINVARVCLQLGDMPCALKHGEEAGHLRGDSEDVLFTLGRIYTVAKKYDEAEKTFMHICEVVKGAASCPYGVALVAAQKGEKDKALAKLQEAVDKKLPAPNKLAEDPLLAPLKDDEGFKQLAAKASGG